MWTVVTVVLFFAVGWAVGGLISNAFQGLRHYLAATFIYGLIVIAIFYPVASTPFMKQILVFGFVAYCIMGVAMYFGVKNTPEFFKNNEGVRHELRIAWTHTYAMPVIWFYSLWGAFEVLLALMVISSVVFACRGLNYTYETNKKTRKLKALIDDYKIIVESDFKDINTSYAQTGTVRNIYKRMMDGCIIDKNMIRLDKNSMPIYADEKVFSDIKSRIQNLKSTKQKFSIVDILDENYATSSSRFGEEYNRKLSLVSYLILNDPSFYFHDITVYNINVNGDIDDRLNQNYRNNGRLDCNEIANELSVPTIVVSEYVNRNKWQYKAPFAMSSEVKTGSSTKAEATRQIGRFINVLEKYAENKNSEQKPLDINNCSVDELADVPHIGKIIAKKAIAHREEKGAFASLDEFFVVAGLRPHIILELNTLLTCSTAKSETHKSIKRGRKIEF